MSSFSVGPREKPGVSTKQIFRSSTASRLLFLLRSTRLSSASVHQCGYGLVLACTSVILAVPALSDLRLRLFDLGGGGWANEVEGDRGSTCTISSHIWTIERTRDVLPIPVSCCQHSLLGIGVRCCEKEWYTRTCLASDHYL
jgi:hypothetical protein